MQRTCAGAPIEIRDGSNATDWMPYVGTQSTPDRVISAQASRDPSQFRTHGEAGARGAAANRRRAAALAASRKTSILRGRGACRSGLSCE